jgi:hypothetical protein
MSEFNRGGVMNKHFQLWAEVLIAFYVTTIAMMSLFKIGGIWFNMPPASLSNSDKCYQRGWTPEFDKNGSYLRCNK